jgi:hypothetical protein
VAGDQLSAAVAETGDVTGDGRADVLAGAPFADAAGRLDAGAHERLGLVGPGDPDDQVLQRALVCHAPIMPGAGR